MVKAALRNPVAVLMLSIALLLLGGIGARRLPVDLFPKLSVPVIIVGTSFRGAPPETVEQSVTFPVERAVAQAWNIATVTSSTRQGLSVVYAWFQWGSDIDAALLDVQQQVQAISDELPEHARAPMISKFDLSSLPISFVTVKGGGLDERELFELANNVLAPQLSAVEGVAAATVSGGRRRQMNIDLDPDELRKTGLSLLDVETAVRQSNVLVPSGTLRAGRMEYDVFSNSQMNTQAELEEVVVKSIDSANGEQVPVRIRDLGTVTDSHRQQSQVVHVDGERAVYMKVYKQPGANTIETVAALRAALPTLNNVPPGVELDTTFEQSTYIENAIKSLQVDAMLGASIVMLTLLLFLASFSSTIIVGLSLPLSFMATLAVLYLTGETLNVFTLGGLALAIGRLVDNAIIVLEAIDRHQRMGKTPLVAALDGSREVAAPVLAGTLTTVIVFLPVFFLTGISKYLFSPMGLVISVSMFASYFVSLTVIPVLMRKFGREPTEEEVASGEANVPTTGILGAFERIQQANERVFERTVNAVMRRKGAFLGLITLAFAGSLALAADLGSDFFPPIDEGEFRVKVRGPIGTRVEESEALAKRVQGLVEEVVPPDVLVGTNTSIGAAKQGLRAMLAANGGPHEVTLRVELTPPGEREHDMEHYITQLRERAATEFPGISVVFVPRGTIKQIINFGYKAPIVVEVRGYDLAQGSELASRIEHMMQEIPGLTDVKTVRQDDYPNLQINVDRQRAARFGVEQEDVARVLLGSVFGNMSKAPFMIDPETGFPFDIITRLAEPHRDDIGDLEQITLQNDGKPVMLKSFAEMKRGSGPLLIERRDIERVAEVTANVAPGASVSAVADAINAGIEDLERPPGFEVALVGQAKDQEETNRSLVAALGVSMFIIYIVMAVQFRSLLHPLIVMFTVPLGLVGVFGAMWVTNTTFSATSMMGIIMMVGIVVGNGILLVDYANSKRQEGDTAEAAAFAAARVRFRPILMTSLSLIVGLIPMSIGGPGGELYAPLARAVMGGLIASTALTLYVVPVLYALVESRFPTDAETRNREDAIIDAA
ncbi:MAG: efflux RND transporter permease subunit [Nannocystaceae bacterium]|nr:efflux RND transporter permease subunit [bacterium]